jgi:hypothetical protein
MKRERELHGNSLSLHVWTPDFGDTSPKHSVVFQYSTHSRTPPYESIRKYTIFLRPPNLLSKNAKIPCLSGFQKIGTLRNVKTAEVKKKTKENKKK